MTKAADEYADIKRRLEEIQAERSKALEGVPIEPPADIDWTNYTGMDGFVAIWGFDPRKPITGPRYEWRED